MVGRQFSFQVKAIRQDIENGSNWKHKDPQRKLVIGNIIKAGCGDYDDSGEGNRHENEGSLFLIGQP